MKENEQVLRGKQKPQTRFELKCVLCYITRLENDPCSSTLSGLHQLDLTVVRYLVFCLYAVR